MDKNNRKDFGEVRRILANGRLGKVIKPCWSIAEMRRLRARGGKESMIYLGYIGKGLVISIFPESHGIVTIDAFHFEPELKGWIMDFRWRHDV